MKTELDCLRERNPVCPYCGKVDHDTWEYGLEDEDSTETTCGNSDKDYRIVCSIDVTYTTSPLNGWPEEEA